MTQFQCRVCARLSPRRIPPADCPRKDECEFELTDTPSAPEASPPSAPPPAAPLPIVPPAHVSMGIAGRAWTITGRTVLGRNGDIAPDVFRTDTGVSRRHCELEPDGAGGWMLRALSTSSPTLLNGVPLSPNLPVPLPPGQNHLLLGAHMTLALTVPGPAPPAPAHTFKGALEEALQGEQP